MQLVKSLLQLHCSAKIILSRSFCKESTVIHQCVCTDGTTCELVGIVVEFFKLFWFACKEINHFEKISQEIIMKIHEEDIQELAIFCYGYKTRFILPNLTFVRTRCKIYNHRGQPLIACRESIEIIVIGTILSKISFSKFGVISSY